MVEAVLPEIQLSQESLALLERLADEGPNQQRAKSIILASSGKSADDIAKEVDLTPQQVRHWLWLYQREGLRIFPEDTLQGAIEERAHDERHIDDYGIALTDHPGVSLDDPMSRAGRKVLSHYFARMMDKEHDVRKGTDGEAVHDMRVATRRLRSALSLFADYFEGKSVKPFLKELRK